MIHHFAKCILLCICRLHHLLMLLSLLFSNADDMSLIDDPSFLQNAFCCASVVDVIIINFFNADDMSLIHDPSFCKMHSAVHLSAAPFVDVIIIIIF
jgi:hypothetical protein